MIDNTEIVSVGRCIWALSITIFTNSGNAIIENKFSGEQFLEYFENSPPPLKN